jgi:phosphoribosylanthranilate isomerase
MSRRPRVKICGITRASDATLAVALGADALGFIFWPRSPRAIAPAAAGDIQATIPAFVSRVGVFVNAPPVEVAAAVRAAGLDVVQLHGEEAVDDYRHVGARIVKVASLRDAQDVDRVATWPTDVMPMVDAIDHQRRGGTGVVADWKLAARLAAVRPIVLAGGLKAGNVGQALAVVRPWGIDVSSGVEEAPGIKGPDRLREFFRELAASQREVV